VSFAQGDELLGDGWIGLGGRVVGSAGELDEAVLAEALKAADPLMGGLAGDGEALGQVGHGVVVELVVFEEPLAGLAHGNTFPGHGHLLDHKVLPMSCYKVLPMSCYKSVTYVPDSFIRLRRAGLLGP
jgi:hypothetical protein